MGFVGRDEELGALNYHYSLDAFQMIVVYGRRRVGKTALLAKFCEERPTLWFTAKEQSAAMNLRDFSTEARRFFGETEDSGAFRTWDDAFSYVARKAEEERRRFVFVFDEFPYAAAVEPSLPSVLQIAIDHQFKGTRVMMVLCGSNEGFMESKVLGYHSPLYGRRNEPVPVCEERIPQLPDSLAGAYGILPERDLPFDDPQPVERTQVGADRILLDAGIFRDFLRFGPA